MSWFGCFGSDVGHLEFLETGENPRSDGSSHVAHLCIHYVFLCDHFASLVDHFYSFSCLYSHFFHLLSFDMDSLLYFWQIRLLKLYSNLSLSKTNSNYEQL